MTPKILAGWLLAVAAVAGEPGPLYLRTIATYAAPALDGVASRELKFLVGPIQAPPEEAMARVWAQVRAASARHGFAAADRPLELTREIKTYYDTPGQDLWRKGYLIRVTQKFKKGSAKDKVGVTIKAILPDARATLATPLKVVGVDDVEIDAEDNVGLGGQGRLASYVEKGASFTLSHTRLGQCTLGDFARAMPELASLGLALDTPLRATRVYAVRAKPGTVTLPGAGRRTVTMEGWSTGPDDLPFLYDVSLGYGPLGFYTSPELHEAGERWLLEALNGELKALALPGADRWGGSKVRRLMNRPITP